jgi:LacI family transcriptional regulator
MELFCGSKANLAVIRPFTAAFNLNERSRGFFDWFSTNSEIRIIDIISPKDQVEDIFAELHRFIVSKSGLQGIFAATSFSHKIADYIDSLQRKEKIRIIGYDLIDENKHRLKNGTIDCLISQRPDEQGRQAVFQVFKKLILKEKPDQNINIPLDIFLKENCFY